MTNTELLSKIKDFVNEQKELLGGFELQSDFRRGETAAYSAILSFLSALESEKRMNQEGLEEEIVKVCEDFVFPLYGLDDEFGRELINKIAHHFANWQKEQMMGEAIEATIDNTAYPTRLWFNTYLSEYANNDKVRIIIVKEEKNGTE